MTRQSDASTNMPNSQRWIVCEEAGRWSAALKAALARRQAASASRAAVPRVQEVRSLIDIEVGVKSHSDAIGFVEVTHENLATVLELLAKYAGRNSRFVALLGADLGGPLAAEALIEAGALCVVSAPRHVGTAIEIAEQYCTVRSRVGAPNSDESIADRAWAALPWQGA
jgi:hypothetical protein